MQQARRASANRRAGRRRGRMSTFAAPQLAVANFAVNAGGWRVDRHPRLLADVTGDGRPDIVGFGDGGV